MKQHEFLAEQGEAFEMCDIVCIECGRAASDDIHLPPQAEGPRCVKCGHEKKFSRGGFCEAIHSGLVTCGCRCEFPAAISAQVGGEVPSEQGALLPCPFAHIVKMDYRPPYLTNEMDEDGNFCVYCPMCSAATGFHDFPETAVRYWNTRTHAASVEALEAEVARLSAQNERVIRDNLALVEMGDVDDKRIEALVGELNALREQFKVIDGKRVTESCSYHGINVAVFYIGDECPLCTVSASVEALVEALKEWQRLDSIKGLDRSVRRKMQTYARQLTRAALAQAREEKGE